MTHDEFQEVSLKLGDVIAGTIFENHVFVVGGAIRDYLLGRPINDIDLVVDLPFGGIGFAEWITRKMGIYKKDSNPLLYGRFGTACFRLWDQEFEVVMSRREAYTEGSRKPEVCFGTIQQDAFRRDFTVNSLMLNISDGVIHDHTSMGMTAIKEGVIETTSEPDSIFKEDPLRMLRAARFGGQLDNKAEGISYFKIGENEVRSMRRNKAALLNISKERINAELVKMLKAKNPTLGIDIMVQTDLMSFVIPELMKLVGLKQNKHHSGDAYVHTMIALANTAPILDQRLAVLFHDIGKFATAVEKEDGTNSFHRHETVGAMMTKVVMKELKFPSKTIDKVAKLVKLHMLTKNWGHKAELASKKSLRKLVAKAGDDLEDLLGVIHADNMAHAPESSMPERVTFIKERIAELKELKEPVDMPIDGKDVMDHFDLRAGAEIGRLLNIAQEVFFENPTISKEDLLESIVPKMKEME